MNMYRVTTLLFNKFSSERSDHFICCTILHAKVTKATWALFIQTYGETEVSHKNALLPSAYW